MGSCNRQNFTDVVVELKRFSRALSLLFFVICYVSFSFQNAHAASGITYTGRIFKGDVPLDGGVVRFDVWIKTKDNCVLYYERRNIDMTGASGTYSFEIGDANIIPGSQSFPQSGIQTIGDIFNNAKSRANGDVDTSLPCSTFNPTADEGRLMTVSFTPAGESAQALPDLAITAVPTAFQAFNANKINGYGTGDLLKVDSAVNKTTYANNALTQAQYDEFWKLILGTSTTYLKSIPTLGGDVTGTLPAMTVVKIQNVAVAAPTTGDTGKVLTYNGTGMVWSAAASGGITTLNGLSGTTQSFVVGNSGTDFNISSSGSAHTFNIPTASSSNRGLLSTTDWTTFNSKQSSTLANGQVWIGNASNGAQAQTLSGDATVSASGVVTVDKTQTGTASKILQLDASGVAVTQGTDIKGAGTGSVQLRYANSSTSTVLTFPASSGTANQFLQTDGAGNLSWASQSAMLPAITAGQVWVGNASNGAQAFTLSGDIASVSNTGLVTLSTSATGSNKLPLAGGTMSGAIAMGGNNITNAGDISLAAGKFLGLGAGSTAGTVAGQIWYDSGIIKYFDGTTTQSLGVAGAGITSLNGLTSGTQSFVNGTSGNSPAFSSAGSAHTLNIPMASASGSVTAGLISNADYASMMAKQSNTLAAGQMWVGNASGVAQAFSLSGDISSVSNTGSVIVNKTTTGQANYILALDGSGIANVKGLDVQSGTGKVSFLTNGAFTNYTLTLPNAAPAANQIMKSDASGNLSWVTYLANVSDSAPLTNGKMWIGNASGVASEVTMSGDATITNAGLLSLKNTGTAGTYTKVITDAQGRVTSGSGLSSGDVTSALGYTPTAGASGYVNGGNTFAGNATIGLNDNYNLGFKTNNTTKMTLTSDGKLGIGTAAPNTALTIASGDITLDAGYSMMWGQSAYSFINGDSGPSSHLILGTSGAIVMTLDVNGNVGIGTSPSFTLDMGSRTDAVRLPVGNTSQRPANTKGIIRYNSSNDTVEYNNGSGWASLSSSLGYTPVNRAGDTMSGDLSTQNINMAAGKFLGLGSGSTAGTVAGQVWYDSGTIKYFDGTTTKSLGVAGAGITTLNGLTANTQSFVNGTSGNAPAFSSAGSAHTLNIPMASASGSVTAGLISNADYASMMAKQSGSLAAGQMWVGNASGAAQAFSLSGDVASVSNTGSVTVNKSTTGQSNYILALDGSGVANAYGFGVKGATSGTVTLQAATTTSNYSLKLPSTTPVANQVMQSDASGNLSWVTALTSSSGFVNGGNSFGTTANLGTNDNNDLNIKTNNATRFSILKTGEVGISPSAGGASFQVHNGGMEISRDDSWPEFTVSGYGNSGGNYWTPQINLTYARGTKSLPTYAQSGDTLGVIRASNHTNGLGAFIRFDATQTHTASVSGTKLSFVTVPNGNNIGNVAMSLAQDGKVAIGSSAPAYALDMQDWTDAIRLPAGNTSQRPANASGLIRYNTTLGGVEYNNGSGWQSVSTSTGSMSNLLSSGQMWVGNASGVAQAFALSGDVSSVSNSGLVTVNKTTTGANNTILSLDGSGVANAYGMGVKGATSGIVTLQAATTTASYSLKLPATTPAANQVMQSDASGNLSWVNGVTTSTGYINGGNTFAGNATIGLNDAFTLGFKTNNATRMTLDASGNLGVGTTTPKGALHIGNTSASTASYAPLVVGDSAATHLGLDRDNLQAYANTSTSTLYLNNLGGDIFFGDGTKGKFDRSLGNIVMLGGGGVQVTSTGAITAASGNIYTSTGKIGAGGVPSYSIDAGTNTDAIRLPAGNTSQRPANATGLFRYNTTNSNVEFNNGSGWSALATSSGSTDFVNGGNSFAGNATIGLNDAYTLGFKTNNTTQMTLDSTGKLGIGTSSPSTALTVVGALQSTSNLPYNIAARDSAAAAQGVGGGIGFEGAADAPDRTFAAIQGGHESATASSYDGFLRFLTRVNGQASLAERMRITSTGRVGIGTTTPSGTLEVQGGTAAASTTGAPITLKAQNGGSGGAVGGSIVLTPGDGTSGWPGGTVVIATTNGQNGAISANNDVTNSYASSGASSAPSYVMRIANSYNQNGNTALIDGTVKNSSALYQEGYMGFVSVTGAANYSPDFVLGLQSGSNSYQERLRINGASGYVGIGTSSPATNLDVVGSAAFENNTASTSAASFSFWKSRNYATVQVNDNLGFFSYYGSDGSSQQRSAYISSTVDNTVAAGSVPGNLVFATTQAGGADSTERMRITSGGNVGINTTPTGNAKLEVSGAIVSVGRSVASGATVNLAQGNTTVLASVGGAAITLQNMVNGGNYTLVIQDTTSRTYTFTGCNTSKYSPANQATISGTPSVYNILTIYNGSTYDCYITWATGFQ